MTFVRPINDQTPRVTNPYSNAHRGTDYGYPEGTPVYASRDGTVTIATNHYVNSWINNGTLTTRDYGNMLKIDHGNGYTTLYAHLKKDSLKVAVGAHVKRGQLIAEVGNTGNSTGAHLHFEIRLNEVVRDPAPLLDTSFDEYGGGGGNMDLQAKYDKLVEKHEQTLKLLRDNEKANGEKDRYLSERDATIANLNQTVNDRNADITKLNAELTTVRGQLQSAEQSRDSYQELAKQVPTLKEELEQALTDRRGAFEQLEATEKVLRGEREEKQKLIDNAPLAFWNYLLARFKRGGEK